MLTGRRPARGDGGRRPPPGDRGGAVVNPPRRAGRGGGRPAELEWAGRAPPGDAGAAARPCRRGSATHRGGPHTITGRTRLTGIIGDPVAHSLSPRLHNAAFAALDLDMVYVPLHVRADDLPAAVAGLRALGFRGANVTIPHKTAVVPLLDELGDDAASMEAVNTVVVRRDGRLAGENTDVAGVRDAVAAAAAAAGRRLAGGRALLLGAGGAARAAALALARLGLALTVANRTPAAAERLAALLAAARPGAACEVRPLAALTAAEVGAADVVVNATSLGMEGHGKVPACVVDNVTAGQVVADMVYTPRDTALLTAARARGATVVDGLEVLVRQAAASFTLWTGRDAPVDVMRHAVEQG